MIHFTKHALEKFEILKRHTVHIFKADVLKTVQNPDLIGDTRRPLKITQRGFDSSRVLRVVYKEESSAKVIITFYPGRKSQYEKGK